MKRPEETNSPLECISFKLSFQDLNYTVTSLSPYSVGVAFDNLNYTNIVLS